jgi:hypothetical protein
MKAMTGLYALRTRISPALPYSQIHVQSRSNGRRIRLATFREILIHILIKHEWMLVPSDWTKVSRCNGSEMIVIRSDRPDFMLVDGIERDEFRAFASRPAHGIAREPENSATTGRRTNHNLSIL